MAHQQQVQVSTLPVCANELLLIGGDTPHPQLLAPARGRLRHGEPVADEFLSQLGLPGCIGQPGGRRLICLLGSS